MKKRLLILSRFCILGLFFFLSCEWPRHVLLNNKKKQDYRVDNNCIIEISADNYSGRLASIWIKPRGCDINILDVENWLKQISDQNSNSFSGVNIGRSKNKIIGNELKLKKNHWLTINTRLNEYLESENAKLVFPKSEYVLCNDVPVFQDTIAFFLKPGKMKFIF